jgi:hypothetical protein
MTNRLKLFLLLVAAIIGWIAWPYYAIYDLVVAFREGDISALENSVEWDSVRQGLRSEFKALFLDRSTAQLKSNDAGGALGTGLALMLVPTMIDQMIDTYVTPEFVATNKRENRTSTAPLAEGAPESLSEAFKGKKFGLASNYRSI